MNFKFKLRSSSERSGCEMGSLEGFEYYSNFHGHLVPHLEIVINALRKTSESIVFLAGDSSFDNKHWVRELSDAVGGYETVLNPTRMLQDVACCVTQEAASRSLKISCINCAVEESALCERDGDKMLDQDTFIRNNIRRHDVLVISVGGNDIVLKPSLKTVLSLGVILMHQKTGFFKGWGLTHLKSMFLNGVRTYAEKLIGNVRPKAILVCMVYYPYEGEQKSWANHFLNMMGYDSDPQELQTLIKEVFVDSTSKIRINGINVIPIPLFEVLDSKDPSDYVQRVEPSEQGGMKIAKALLDKCFVNNVKKDS